MILLGLDLATTTGWATFEARPGKTPLVDCGSYKASGSSEGRVFASFAKQTADLIDRVKPDRIALEHPIASTAGGDWVQDLAGPRRKQIKNEVQVRRQLGIRGIALAIVAGSRHSRSLPMGIAYSEVAIQSWRKSFFGAGVSAPKNLPAAERRTWWKNKSISVARELGEKWGFMVPDDNAAEAVGIVCWLAAQERTGRLL